MVWIFITNINLCIRLFVKTQTANKSLILPLFSLLVLSSDYEMRFQYSINSDLHEITVGYQKDNFAC